MSLQVSYVKSSVVSGVAMVKGRGPFKRSIHKALASTPNTGRSREVRSGENRGEGQRGVGRWYWRESLSHRRHYIWEALR